MAVDQPTARAQSGQQKPLLVALNYSAGVQSEWMVYMILLGIIPRPERLAIFNADPGMENSISYQFVAAMQERCKAAGIDFIKARGPNLFTDILELKDSNKTRFDNPPFWTKSRKGKDVGQLIQKCTQAYKVAPMDRAVRAWLNTRWAIGVRNSAWLAEGSVEKWIGFSADEQDRADGLMETEHQKYVRFRFPLIEAGLTKSDIVQEYLKRDLPIPPPSLCDACPYKGLRQLKVMHDEQPEDWNKAVAVDDACRDLTQIGVDEQCYVSKTLIPLRQLAEMKFDLGNEVENDLHQCPSGSCFI